MLVQTVSAKSVFARLIPFAGSCFFQHIPILFKLNLKFIRLMKPSQNAISPVCDVHYDDLWYQDGSDLRRQFQVKPIHNSLLQLWMIYPI